MIKSSLGHINASLDRLRELRSTLIHVGMLESRTNEQARIAVDCFEDFLFRTVAITVIKQAAHVKHKERREDIAFEIELIRDGLPSLVADAQLILTRAAQDIRDDETYDLPEQHLFSAGPVDRE